MRLIIISAVYHCIKCRIFLDHRAGKSLTEGIGRQLYLVHAVPVIQYTGTFVRKVDPCPASEIKQSLVFQEWCDLHFHSDLHHRIVTGIFDNLTSHFHDRKYYHI